MEANLEFLNMTLRMKGGDGELFELFLVGSRALILEILLADLPVDRYLSGSRKFILNLAIFILKFKIRIPQIDVHHIT